MITRTFYTADEAIELLDGDSHMFRELVEFHGLHFYTKVNRLNAEHMDDEGFLEDTLAASGSYEHARWTYFKGRPATEGRDATDPHYSLSGWFEISHVDSLKLVEDEHATNASLSSFKDGVRHGSFYDTGLNLRLYGVRVRAADIARLKLALRPADTFARDLLADASPRRSDSDTGELGTDEQAEKGLSTRKRNNLLRIIAALAKHAGIDTSEGGKGATQIEKAVELAGFSGPKEKAIREVLAEIRDLE